MLCTDFTDRLLSHTTNNAHITKHDKTLHLRALHFGTHNKRHERSLIVFILGVQANTRNTLGRPRIR